MARGVAGIAVARLFIMLVGTVLAIALLGIIALTVDGVERIVVLATLTPILVFTVLVVWRSIGAANQASARRRAAIAEIHRQYAIGVLAYPASPELEEQINRHVVLPADRRILLVTEHTVYSAAGQQRLRLLDDLLDRRQPMDRVLDVPVRAILALIGARGFVQTWDLSALLERANAGDDAARTELHDLEQRVREQLPQKTPKSP